MFENLKYIDTKMYLAMGKLSYIGLCRFYIEMTFSLFRRFVLHKWKDGGDRIHQPKSKATWTIGFNLFVGAN